VKRVDNQINRILECLRDPSTGLAQKARIKKDLKALNLMESDAF
jgi:hypothetical protein